jgi:hypothetical protein
LGPPLALLTSRFERSWPSHYRRRAGQRCGFQTLLKRLKNLIQSVQLSKIRPKKEFNPYQFSHIDRRLIHHYLDQLLAHAVHNLKPLGLLHELF